MIGVRETLRRWEGTDWRPFVVCAGILAGTAMAWSLVEYWWVGENPDLHKNFVDRYLPIGRFGRMEEAAQACLFLASDEASYFVGEVISPNGGITL